MQRFTRIAALILVLVTFFMVPVSADDLDNTGAWVNVLDYATLNDSGCNYINFTNSVTVRFDTKIQSLVRFVDILVETAGTDITSASINGSQLSIVALDSQVFRIYGQVSNILTGVYDLTFTSNGTCYLDFMQFQVNGQWRLSYDDVGSLSWSSASTGTGYVAQSSPGEIVYTTWLDSDAAYPVFFYAMVSCDNWRKYDYLDVYIHATVSSIDSVTASYNGLFIPLEYDYLGGAESTTGNYKMHFRMDLTGLDRSLGGSPILNISGLYSPHVSTSAIQLRYVMGSVVTDPVDPYLNFFRIYADSQFAYYDSIISAHQQMYSLVSTGLRTLSADITAASSFIVKEISDLLTSIIARIFGFQLSMETYLDALPRRIAEEISKVFTPTEGKFEAAKDESQELAEDKLGAVYQSAVVIDQIAGAFTNQSPQTSIAIPLVSVEVLPGVPFAFGGWDVPVVPSGLEFFVETLKFVIDIVCTLAFLNGMKRRLEGLFGGESGAD